MNRGKEIKEIMETIKAVQREIEKKLTATRRPTRRPLWEIEKKLGR